MQGAQIGAGGLSRRLPLNVTTACDDASRLQNDALMRLPSQTSAEASSSCLPSCHGDARPGHGFSISDDGPEQVVTADDYVRQRMAAVSASRPPPPAQPSNNSPPAVRWRNRRNRESSVR